MPWPDGLIVFDALQNQGHVVADKCRHAWTSDWQDLIAVRQSGYDAVVARFPHLAKFATGWRNRLDSLSNFAYAQSRA